MNIIAALAFLLAMPAAAQAQPAPVAPSSPPTKVMRTTTVKRTVVSARSKITAHDGGTQHKVERVCRSHMSNQHRVRSCRTIQR